MTYVKAAIIFYEIDSDEYTLEEKREAIFKIVGMATHNSIRKDAMLRVIKFLIEAIDWEGVKE